MVGLLSVITVILTAWALKASVVVTMPLAFAFFVAILVHPIERTLAARLPRRLEWLGVACAMLAVVGTLALALSLIALALEPVVARAPQYADQLQGQWDSLRAWARDQGSRCPRPATPEPASASGGMQASCRAEFGGRGAGLSRSRVLLHAPDADRSLVLAAQDRGSRSAADTPPPFWGRCPRSPRRCAGSC